MKINRIIFLTIILIHTFCILPKKTLRMDNESNKNSILDSLTMDQLGIAQIKLTYLGEQEKPIATLIGYSYIICVTDISLVTLYTLGIPDIIVSKLSSLLEKQYYSRTSFIRNLEKIIGVENTDKYVSKILEVSTISSGRDIKENSYSIIYDKHKIYSNDISVNFKKFSITPEELFKIIRGLNYEEQPTKKDRLYSFSLIYMAYKEEDKMYCIKGKEIFKDYYQGKDLFINILHSLDKENNIAHRQISSLMNYLY